MTKKTRRTRSTPRLTSAQLVGTEATPADAAPTAGGAAPMRRTAASGPRTSTLAREDYSYVVGDLKRIVVIAAILLVVMVVLAYVLPQVIR